MEPRARLVFGGLAVDDVSRAARIFGRVIGADAGTLFADDEEQAEIALAGLEQRFGGLDHASDDALDVAGAAAVNEFGILGRGEEGRNGIEVSGQRDVEAVCPSARIG